MKTLSICALVCLAGLDLKAADPRESTISLTIESISSDGGMKIGIHNKSADEVSVWMGCNSWANFNWRVIDVRNDETRLYCPNPTQYFTTNFEQRAAIKPGAMITEDIKLGGEDNWANGVRPLLHQIGPQDTRPLLQNGDRIIVIYDVRWSEEANQYHVWSGITEVSQEFHPK